MTQFFPDALCLSTAEPNLLIETGAGVDINVTVVGVGIGATGVGVDIQNVTASECIVKSTDR
jgi:hypothetical protein